MEKPVSESVRQEVLALIANVGQSEACERLAIGVNALARLAAGLPVKKGTATLVALQLRSFVPATQQAG